MNIFNLAYRYIFNCLNWAKCNSVFFFSNFNHKCLNNSKCKWKSYTECTAFSIFSLNLDISTKSFNLWFYNIKTNTSSGYICNFIWCWKTWLKQKINCFFFCKCICLLLSKVSFFNSFLFNLLYINTITIISYFYDNIVALLICIKPYRTNLWLASLSSYLCAFKSMVSRIS